MSTQFTRPRPTGRERTFGTDEIIVSKTDTKGVITYANTVFQRVAGYTEEELLGQPHNIVRHPDMPRCVFKLLWDTLERGEEIFAYVVNLAKNGDHYWVLAHVTPTFDDTGNIIGYHSSRRSPSRAAIDAIQPVYAALLAEEAKHESKKQGMQAGADLLAAVLQEQGKEYDEFAFSL
ncbi:MAG TPA: PAS domain S-box protein [Planctomycetes bacterium]|nr:PAS domain S-box protein [Planctomycetota bacterium]